MSDASRTLARALLAGLIGLVSWLSLVVVWARASSTQLQSSPPPLRWFQGLLLIDVLGAAICALCLRRLLQSDEAWALRWLTAIVLFGCLISLWFDRATLPTWLPLSRLFIAPALIYGLGRRPATSPEPME